MIIVLQLQGFRILQLCFLALLKFTTIFTLMSHDLFCNDPRNMRLYFHNLQSFSINFLSIAKKLNNLNLLWVYLNLLKGVSDWNEKNVEPLLMVTVTFLHYQFCEEGNKKLWENAVQLAFIGPRGKFCGSSSLLSVGQ